MTTTTMTDPVAQWDAEVSALMRGGMSKTAAVSHLASSNPQLHRAYLAEYNVRASAKQKDLQRSSSPGFVATSTTADHPGDRALNQSRGWPAVSGQAECAADPATLPPHRRPPVAITGDAIAEWDAAVDAEMRKGLDRPAANRNVAAANPDLQQRYVVAYNQAVKAGLKPGARHR